MPGRDRNGPMGRGALTGRGMGFCVVPAQNDAPFRGMGFGRGCGNGRGMGRGMGRGFGRGFGYGSGDSVSMDPAIEREALAYQQEMLARQMDAIKRRMETLAGNEEESR